MYFRLFTSICVISSGRLYLAASKWRNPLASQSIQVLQHRTGLIAFKKLLSRTKKGQERNRCGQGWLLFNVFFFLFFSCDTINIVHLCFDEVREMMLSRSASTTSITPTTRTTLITLVTTMTWRALSSTADARGASVRPDDILRQFAAASTIVYHVDISP